MDFSGKIPARFLRTAPIRVRGGEVEASAPEMKICPAIPNCKAWTAVCFF